MGASYPVFSGSTDDDLYFDGVIFDDIQIPEDLSGTTIASEVEVKGTGSLTIGDQRKGILPRILIFGGTVIEGSRVFEDGEILRPWEGVFTVPEMLTIADVGEVVFVEEGKHDKSQTRVVTAFQMGDKNETFNFDPTVILSLPISEPEGKKILLAFNDEDNDEAIADEEWLISEGEFCIVENGACTFEVTGMNSVALVQEIYYVCPRTVLAHGTISRKPECMITCDFGYELNSLANDCVEAVEEDFDEGDELLPVEEDFEMEEREYVELGTAWEKGYIRYRPSRDQLNYVDNTRARPLTDQFAVDSKVVVEEKEDTGFFNYLLAMRNRFGEKSDTTVVDLSEAIVETGDFEELEEGESISLSEEFKSTAPLLPASGPGIFAGIAAIGMGMMIFGVRKK